MSVRVVKLNLIYSPIVVGTISMTQPAGVPREMNVIVSNATGATADQSLGVALIRARYGIYVYRKTANIRKQKKFDMKENEPVNSLVKATKRH